MLGPPGGVNAIRGRGPAIRKLVALALPRGLAITVMLVQRPCFGRVSLDRSSR